MIDRYDLLVHLFKCLKMYQVMTQHRCSEIIKADFELEYALLDKGNKSSDIKLDVISFKRSIFHSLKAVQFTNL